MGAAVPDQIEGVCSPASCFQLQSASQMPLGSQKAAGHKQKYTVPGRLEAANWTEKPFRERQKIHATPLGESRGQLLLYRTISNISAQICSHEWDPLRITVVFWEGGGGRSRLSNEGKIIG